MKIALVILHANPARGGAERYTVDLASALAQRGHEVDLLAQTFAPDFPAEVRPITMPSATMRALSYARFLSGVDAQIDQSNYDIVHAMLPIRRCDVYHPHAGMAAEQMSKFNRLVNPRRIHMARVERKLLEGKNAPIVLSLSDYVGASIRRHYTDVRLMKLFNGVDLRRFSPLPPTGAIRSQLPPGEVVGLFIGKDFKRKGLFEAVQAVGQLGRNPPALAVVGKTDWRGYGIASPAFARIVAIGATADPRPFYADADFFVLPTRHDPCSLVVLEALAMGLPVISTVFNGATEIMTDGVHGFILSDPGDINALADAMRKMLDPETRRRMSRACLELRPTLAYDHHVDRLLNIYANAIRKPL